MLVEDDKSYLSKNVYHLLVELAKETELSAKQQYVGKDLIFDWCKIQLIFGDIKDDFNILEQSEIWYTEKLKEVWLVIHDAKKALFTVEDDTGLKRLWALCTFTGYQEQLKECFSVFKKDIEVGGVHITLKLTAMLERLLGNIFLIEGKSVPFLLRDLLNTPELKKILGKVPVIFMQMLFGSPKGLNIRNVIWHGFIFPEELHSSLVCSLFLLFPSIGQLLLTQTFPLRPQVTNFDEYANHLDNVFPDALNHRQLVLDIWHNTQYISSQHFNLWKAAYQLYSEEKYGDCLILLLPQLEHLLRSVYCHSNGCSQRLLTAESTTLYTTLDEIVLPHLAEKDSVNKLYLLLGEGLILMLEDILSTITGPRLRDKLSHGECSLNNIPRNLANHLMCIALSVCIKANGNSQTGINNKATELSQNELCSSENNCPQTFHDALLHACERYESRFHIGVMLQRFTLGVVNQLGSLSNLPLPSEIAQNKLQIDSQVLKMKNCIFGCVTLSYSECVDIVHKNCKQIKPITLNRPRYETELIVLFSNIVKNISLTITKITDGNNERFNQFEAHTLRSRARQTYQRMHQAVPTLQCTLLCIIAVIVAVFKIVYQIDSDQCQDHVRFAKKMLKIVENTASFCDFEKNRWNESCKIASDFSKSAVSYLELNKVITL